MSRRKELIETLVAMATLNGHTYSNVWGNQKCGICRLTTWHEHVLGLDSNSVYIGSAVLQQCKTAPVYSPVEEKQALCDILTKEFGIECRPS